MSRLGKHLIGPLKQIVGDQKGIAAVEFALIVPVLMLTYLGATDVTQGLAIDRKLGQVASTVSDLVAQEDGITSDQVHAFFESGIAIMRPFDFERTKLRLTIIEVEGGSTTVTGATARNWEIEASNGETYELPSNMEALADGRYVVVAEASYDYTPLFGTVFDSTLSLQQRSLHTTRKDVVDFGFSPDGSSVSGAEPLEGEEEVVDETETGETGDDGSTGEDEGSSGDDTGSSDSGDSTDDDDDDDSSGGWGGGWGGGCWGWGC